MIYLRLFWEFFRIGLFSVGGGLATLPFLYDLAEKTGWYPTDLIIDMIAVAESTPGPIGINMATYVGCTVGGFLGGVVATFGEILPSIIIVILLARSLEKVRGNRLVEDAFYGLRPAVAGLVGAAVISVAQTALFRLDLFAQTGAVADLFQFKRILWFGVCFVAMRRFKLPTVVYIAASAAVGVLFAF